MKFGDKIKVYGKLMRVVEHRGVHHNTSGVRTRIVRWKVWKECALRGLPNSVSNSKFFGLLEIDAVFLGNRTLSNGETYWEEDCGYVYTPKEYVEAYLVCIKGQNPFYVQLNQIIIL